MKIETQDIYQSDKTEYGYQIEVEADNDVYLRVNGQPICCLSPAEAVALAKALKTMAKLA